MKGKFQRKRILGATLILLLGVGSFVTFEVVKFNQGMEELGSAIGEAGAGLHELGQGLASIRLTSDTSDAAVDTLNMLTPEVDTTLGIVD